MSDKQTILDALKVAGAPDYMVLIITEVVGAKDEIRAVMAELNTRAIDVRQREDAVQQREQVLQDQQQAFMSAVEDLKTFVNRIYGPDSELTKINQRLGGIEAAGATRDRRYAERFEAIDANQTRLRDDFEQKFKLISDRFIRLEGRVENLEKTA